MSKQDKNTAAQEQRYDTTFKALLDDVTLALLSFLFGEEIIFAQELKESLFKQDTIKPALRVDCAFYIRSRLRELAGIVIGHVEFETAPASNIGARLFEYAAMLYNMYLVAVVQVLVCPFETSALPRSPLQLKWGEEIHSEHRYRVVALWQYEASKLVEQGQVELYALLPTMKGATYVLLVQALKDMRAFHTDESRLCQHLMWFDALLGRTTTVTPEVKRRVHHAMVNEFRSLLDEGFFVKMRVAESREEGEAKGRQEGRQQGLVEGFAQGEAKGREEGETKGREEGETKGREEGLTEGLTEALLTATELRFPALLDLAQERVKHARRPENLRLILKGVKAATSEESARFLLDLLAA